MKYNFLSSFLFLFILNVSSQNKGIIYYGQIESINLKGPHGPDFNAYLTFNSNGSYYVTAKDSLDTKTKFKRSYDNPEGTRGISFSVYTTKNGKQVYFNKKTDSLYWNKWENFYVAEKRPEIEWKLEAETKKIGTFLVHKATGEFRGRTYTAWYSLDIPLPYGPWKLNGLPGLILEAHDNDKEMFIYFKSLEYPTTKSATVKMIDAIDGYKIKWRTLDDYKKRLDKIYERKKNSSISIAQKLNTEVPEQKIKSEAFLESF